MCMAMASFKQCCQSRSSSNLKIRLDKLRPPYDADGFVFTGTSTKTAKVLTNVNALRYCVNQIPYGYEINKKLSTGRGVDRDSFLEILEIFTIFQNSRR